MLNFYKDMLSCLDGGELASLLYMYRGSTMEYSKKWCQDALGFVYRMMQSGLIWIAYFDEYDTAEEAKNIFEQMAEQSPNIIDGLAIWSTYQYYFSGAGQAFWDEWKTSDDDALYWQKLNHIFDEHHVGFDKSCFVPVKFE